MRSFLELEEEEELVDALEELLPLRRTVPDEDVGSGGDFASWPRCRFSGRTMPTRRCFCGVCAWLSGGENDDELSAEDDSDVADDAALDSGCSCCACCCCCCSFCLRPLPLPGLSVLFLVPGLLALGCCAEGVRLTFLGVAERVVDEVEEEVRRTRRGREESEKLKETLYEALMNN